MTGNRRILISGATGFIGSHVALQLIKAGYNIIAATRNQSVKWRCKNFSDQITWINVTENNWDTKIKELKPEILIHTAWEGLEASERNNWVTQNSNFEFSTKLFQIAVASGINKIIALGSQAEYGIFSGRINEQHIPVPADAYGATKLHTSNYLRIICQQNNISWYWLRVFSVFGPKENESWLLPQAIKCLLINKSIDLTDGGQLYDYLFINDFTKAFLKIVDYNGANHSGIYNFSSGASIKLKDLLSKLPPIIGSSNELLNFGAIPYRSIQSIHMEGDCTKFENVFGKIFCTSIDQSLVETVDYYKSRN